MHPKYSLLAQTTLTKAESLAFEFNSNNVDETHLMLSIIYQSDFITNQYFRQLTESGIETITNNATTQIKSILQTIDNDIRNSNNDLNNTIKWVSLMYYFNLFYSYDAIDKLYNYQKENYSKYICYGTIYHFHNIESISKYGWMYMGSFHWLNSTRLFNYMNENNIDINFLACGDRLRTCAETFLFFIFDNTHVAFLYDEWYNKNYNPLQYDSPDISYKEIEYCTLLYMDYDTIVSYFDFFDKYIMNNKNDQ